MGDPVCLRPALMINGELPDPGHSRSVRSGRCDPGRARGKGLHQAILVHRGHTGIAGLPDYLLVCLRRLHRRGELQGPARFCISVTVDGDGSYHCHLDLSSHDLICLHRHGGIQDQTDDQNAYGDDSRALHGFLPSPAVQGNAATGRHV